MSTWGQGQWNLGSWGNSASGAVISGQQLTSSVNSVTANTEVRSGWGRVTWGAAAWGQSPDASISITGNELEVDLNLGFGWGREEWGRGSWGQTLGFVFTGNGKVFSISTLSALSSSLNNVSVIGNSPITISTAGQLTTSAGDVSNILGNANVSITGEDIIAATVNTFAVVAGGAITINTPTLEANTSLNNDGIVVGLANFLDITGQGLTVSLNDISLVTNNIISVTGEQLTTTANTITLSTQQILSITGQEITIASANIVPNSQNFLSITGNQANISINSLKFWDPILPTNTETWTNIH